MAGRGWTQLQIEADGCTQAFQIQTWFPFTTVPGGQRGQQPASEREFILCTPEESEPHFYHQDTLNKQQREKKKHAITAQRECCPSEVQQYISVGFTHTDKAAGMTALSLLPLAYFIRLNCNGFWGIQYFCFHITLVLIVIHDDLYSSVVSVAYLL